MAPLSIFIKGAFFIHCNTALGTFYDQFICPNQAHSDTWVLTNLSG